MFLKYVQLVRMAKFPLPTPNYQTPAVAIEQDHQQTIICKYGPD